MSSTNELKELNGFGTSSGNEGLADHGENSPPLGRTVSSMDKTKKQPRRRPGMAKKPTGLKKLAAHLGLDPTTVSVVLNDVPGGSIPQATRDRIKAAAKKFNYQPSLLARSLRNRRTFTIGILVPELGDGYHTQVMSGIGDHLMEAGYFYFRAHHRRRKNLVEKYGQMLLGRGAEALILAGGRTFTALVAFNDMSAIGAIRALQDLGLKVPYDVSVIGFDDIRGGAFNNRRLTTIRQPLSNMGRIAAQCVLNRLNGSGPFRKLVMVEPELAVRESTSAIDQAARSDNRKKS